MKIVVQILSYKLPWAKMFVWLTSGDSPAARTWLIATAISVGLKGSKGCADWDLYCTGNPADSSQVSKFSINLSKFTNAPISPSLEKNQLSYLQREARQKDRRLQGCHQTWIVVFLHFWVGLSLYRIPIQALQGLEAPEDLASFLFKDEHLVHARTSQPTPISPKSKFPQSWLKIPSSPDTLDGS